VVAKPSAIYRQSLQELVPFGLGAAACEGDGIEGDGENRQEGAKCDLRGWLSSSLRPAGALGRPRSTPRPDVDSGRYCRLACEARARKG
jgi:hypothetical protein